MAEVKLCISLDTKQRILSGKASKAVESVFTVTPGMVIEDFAWRLPREVVRVYFSTDTPDTLTVYLGLDEAESEADFRQLVEMYRGHGWEVKIVGEALV